MNLQINTRYRLKSNFNTHLTVGTLKIHNNVKIWCIKCSDGSVYEAVYEYYSAICEW